MIHADLHSGNLLVRGEDVLVIDFSLCGYGSFLFDISIALVAGVPAEFRQDYLNAYRRCRPLPDELLPLVEAYGLAGVLSYCAFQVGNPEQWEWLTNRIPRLAAGECHRISTASPSIWTDVVSLWILLHFVRSKPHHLYPVLSAGTG